MKRAALMCLIAAVLFSQKLTTSKSDTPVYSVWFSDTTCGGLKAETWSDGKGWHAADCMEIATKLSELRDVRSVLVESGPSVAQMLAYQQYGNYFRVSRADFRAAQAQCRKLLTDGYAHSDILAQCKQTVAGVVPYGLKLKD